MCEVEAEILDIFEFDREDVEEAWPRQPDWRLGIGEPKWL